MSKLKIKFTKEAVDQIAAFAMKDADPTDEIEVEVDTDSPEYIG